MAQADIHPKQHQVTIKLNDGQKIEIMTTHGKAGDVLPLDVDPTNHPAWQTDNKAFVNVNSERVNKFNKKFGNFDFGAAKTETSGS